MTLAQRLAAWFGVDDQWERPLPARWRAEVIAVLVLAVVGVSEQELLRSVRSFDNPRWRTYAAFAVLLVPLVWRRRHPLVVAIASASGLFAVSMLVEEVAYQTTVNVAVFFATYSGLAWARDRRAVPLAVGGVLAIVLGWYAAVYAWGSGVQALLDRGVGAEGGHGLLSPIPAAILNGLLLNLAFFLGALAMGANAWRHARDEAVLAEQAEQIAAQQDELKDRAVVAERLRIARELHDVAAQHVAAMGVQASAARRLLHRRPEEANVALTGVEESARKAVAEMRTLLGTLRAGELPEGSRAPEPGLGELPALMDEARREGVDARLRVVEEQPGDLASLPGPVALALYRTAQEALTNTRKHSTARTAEVTVRTLLAQGRRAVEVEVLDDGRPRTGTSGTGLGLLGVRERVAALEGSCEIGPRATGGYRVRVRFPLGPVRS